MLTFCSNHHIQSDIVRIERLRAWLDRRGPELTGWKGRLRRELEAEAIAASTSMEGVPVTVAEVVRLLGGDRPHSVSPTDAQLVRGYREAMRHAFVRSEAPDFAWSPELLLALHAMAMAPSTDAWPGRFREDSVFVVDTCTHEVLYEPPPARDVAVLMARLCDLANTADVPAPVLSALVHVGLARIHPFRDGNGRVARIAASLAMYHAGFHAAEFTTLEEWWGRHLAEYYRTLRALGPAWDDKVDVTPFVEAHVRAQRLQVEARALSNRTEYAVWVALENVVAGDLVMPPRGVDALFDAFFGREVTNRYYRSITDVSPATAVNDLARLLASGLVEARGAGPSRVYTGSFRLLTRVASEAGVPILADAEASLEMQRATVLHGIAEMLRERSELGPKGIEERCL